MKQWILLFLVYNVYTMASENTYVEINKDRLTIRAHLMQFELDPDHFKNVLFLYTTPDNQFFKIPSTNISLSNHNSAIQQLLSNNFIAFDYNKKKKLGKNRSYKVLLLVKSKNNRTQDMHNCMNFLTNNWKSVSKQ